VIVRPERPDDRATSLDIERAAFGGEEEAAVVATVRDIPTSFAFVAEHEGTLVGHVQFSIAWVGNRPVFALGPIAVVPDRQGQGIGRALIEAGLAEARARAVCAVIVLGAPDLYGRFGFQPGASLGLTNPFAGVQEGGFVIEEEDFQVAVLDVERASELAGPVRWHPAFG
jgi:putative acetyltransferase